MISVRDLDQFLLRGRNGLLAMFEASFDESEGGTSRHFVISGYVSRPGEWRKFERRWRNALSKDGFPCMKWADLEGGYGKVFGHLHGDREAKDAIQRRYLRIITTSQIQGFAAALKMADLDAFAPRIFGYRTEKYDRPYFLAFELAIGRVITFLRHFDMLLPNEKIGFVFDRQKEVGGRAKELYDKLKGNPLYQFREHLGPIAFEDKEEFLPIQAADVVAWESMRDFSKGDNAQRWQIGELLADGGLHAFCFREIDFERFAGDLEKHMTKEVDSHKTRRH